MKKKISIFYILLCINLCSITILSAFNYLVFHGMNGRAYLKSFVDYNERVTGLAFHNIDRQVMEPLADIPQLYFSDVKANEALLLPRKKPVIGRPGDIFALAGKMEEIKKAYPVVVSMDVYYEGTKTVVTGFDKVHFPENEEELNRYLPWYFGFERLGVNQCFFGLSNNAYPLEEPFITYVKRMAGRAGTGIVAAFHISPNSFGEYVDEDKGVFILADQSLGILYESGDPDSSEGSREVIESILKDREGEPGETGEPIRGGEPARSWQIKLSGESVMVFSDSFPLMGLNYVYYMPTHAFLADYNVKSRIFLWNFGTSILFNVLVLAVISYINYLVYHKRVLSVSKEAGISIKGDGKGFDRSITALTETITDLNETVKSSEEVLYQNSLRSLILNRKPEQAYETLFSGCKYSRVCCFIAYLNGKDWEGLSLSGLQNGFAESGVEGNVYFTTMAKGEVVMAAVCDEEGAGKIQTALLKVFRRDVELACFVSGVTYGLGRDNLSKSFRSASETARYRFIYSRRILLSWEELKLPERKGHGSHLKVFAALEKDLNTENLLDFRFHVEAIKASFWTGSYTIDYCHSTLRDLVTMLYRIIQGYRLDTWIVFGYDIREYYKQLADLDAFCDWVNRVCEVLFTNLRQIRDQGAADLKGELEQLIEEYLERDISLDYLSERLTLRPDALSRLFRQLMGKSYSEYVKEKKLIRAIELMEQDCAVKEIAHRLGYSTPQYFIKLFREAYGITPYQYKKKMNKEGDGRE